jgi:hypothetical protein
MKRAYDARGADLRASRPLVGSHVTEEIPLPAPRPRLAALVAATALLLAAAVPATASAFGLSGVRVAPADPRAGAHSDLTIHFDVTDPSADLKKFVIHLPSGQVGDPKATALCPEQQFLSTGCDPATQVGTTTVTANALGLPQTVNGEIFNVAPTAPDVARLGIVLHPSLGGDQRLLSPVRLRSGDGGLDSTLDNVPRQAGGLSIDVTSIDIKLSGQVGGKSFSTNPTACSPAETTIDAYSYAAPDQAAQGKASYTPTDCGSVPYAPTLTAIVGGAGQTAKGGHPAVTTVVGGLPGQANSRRVTVTLPAGIGVDQAALVRACPGDQLAAAACPPASIIGTATSVSPLLSAPLKGPVTLVQPAPGQGPVLVVDLSGFGATIRLIGKVGFVAGLRLQTIFDGLPDVPLTSFSLDLAAKGVSGAARDLCTGPGLRADAAFDAQSGAHATANVPVQIVGCPPGGPGAAKATATLMGLRSRHPVLTVTVAAARGARLSQAGFSLPRALRFDTRRARRALTVLAGGRRVAKPVVRVASGAIAVGGFGSHGTAKVQLRLRRGALRLARTLKAGSRVTIKVAYTDAAGKPHSLAVKVRAGR